MQIEKIGTIAAMTSLLFIQHWLCIVIDFYPCAYSGPGPLQALTTVSRSQMGDIGLWDAMVGPPMVQAGQNPALTT